MPIPLLVRTSLRLALRFRPGRRGMNRLDIHQTNNVNQHTSIKVTRSTQFSIVFRRVHVHPALEAAKFDSSLPDRRLGRQMQTHYLPTESLPRLTAFFVRWVELARMHFELMFVLAYLGRQITSQLREELPRRPAP